MGLFGQAAPPPDAPPAPPRPRLRVLRADGQRIDLTKRDAGQSLVATRQSWQKEAWNYRSMIGELRYAFRLLARSTAKVRFYVAAERAWPDGPTPLDVEPDPDSDESPAHDLDAQLVADAVHNFNRLPMTSDPDGFTARLAENLAVTGEAWVHIDAEDRFQVRSVTEVTASQDGRVTLATLPGAGSNAGRQINADTESLLRCWVPDPEWGQLADAPMRALLDVAEDVVLAGREQRTAARSRLASNGILFISESMSVSRARTDEDEDEGDTFMRDLTAAMLAPISDDADSGAVVPIVVRANPDDIEKAKHLVLSRADSDQLIGRQSTALLRLLRGLDIQPEQVDGVGNGNHWSAWAIEARSIRDQVQPAAQTLATCLMQAFLRPALESLGHPPEQIDRVTIAVDVSPLSENPNRGQDARDAHAALAISDDAFRTALGFDDDDKPDDDERLYRMAAAGRLSVDHAAAVLGIQTAGKPMTVPGQAVPRTALPAADRERPAASPGETVPSRPVPEAPDLARGPGPVVAAAAPDEEWRVEVATVLADIDAALLDRITVAADAAVARVVEKAGARVRSAAQKDRALTAALTGMDAHLIAAHLGRERVAAFAPIDDLLRDSYNRPRSQVTRWLTDAAGATADAVLGLLRLTKTTARGRKVHDTVTIRLTARVPDALRVLDEVLDEAAERALFARDPFTPDDGPGETTGALVRAGEVRRVLDTAGGGGGGVGTGDTTRRAIGDEGGVILGYEWHYRPEILRNTFPPHLALNGLRFATFTDPKLDTGPTTAWLGPYFSPGDHMGCRCTAVPILVWPELDDGVVARRLREAAGDPRNLLAAQVAEADTEAGRVGTSLQNEVEVRTRITDAIERLTAEHIAQGGTQ